MCRGDCAARFVSVVYSLIPCNKPALIYGFTPPLQVWRVVLLCAGLGCWLCPLIRRREPHVAGLILGLIAHSSGGEMIGRVLFYGLHMTVGMAIAG
ncbi:DmsC/YnfH family molybdoenzyme membrane anchor subunit [Escherichia coli]